MSRYGIMTLAALALSACSSSSTPPHTTAGGSGGVSSTGAATSTAGSSTTTSSSSSGGVASTSTTGSGSTTSGSTSGGSTSTGGTTGSTLPGHESWAWVYVDYPASLGAIASNTASFTHISPTFYTLNYAYASGVAYYSNCSGDTSCTDTGTDDFDGMTTQQITTQINNLNLLTVPLIYAGANNNGVDTGVQNILNDTNGAQESFISSMVQEAVSKGYAGYNLDWEMGSGVDATYAASFVTFVDAFKTALAAHQMSLSADAIVANINGTYCSSNNGYLDFGLLSASSLDRMIIEDYTASYGTTYATCQSVILSSENPADCPLNSAQTDVTFTGLLNFMCSNLPAGMVVIGLESNSGGTNGFAGEAISTMQSYGMDKVAIWPEQEGTYPYLSNQGLVATQSTWYDLLVAFLQH